VAEDGTAEVHLLISHQDGSEATCHRLFGSPRAAVSFCASLVDQGAMQGNAALQCNYKFQMDKPGGVIRRMSCDVQSMFP
jgi:hypothetical protein